MCKYNDYILIYKYLIIISFENSNQMDKTIFASYYFFFFKNLGVIPINNSKLIPDIGLDSAEK